MESRNARILLRSLCLGVNSSSFTTWEELFTFPRRLVLVFMVSFAYLVLGASARSQLLCSRDSVSLRFTNFPAKSSPPFHPFTALPPQNPVPPHANLRLGQSGPPVIWRSTAPFLLMSIIRQIQATHRRRQESARPTQLTETQSLTPQIGFVPENTVSEHHPRRSPLLHFHFP
jgi:hypothetical protein